MSVVYHLIIVSLSELKYSPNRDGSSIEPVGYCNEPLALVRGRENLNRHDLIFRLPNGYKKKIGRLVERYEPCG